MKKVFFAASAALCCYFISCNNKGGNDANISSARDIMKGIETGDTSKFTSIAANTVDHAGPTGEVNNGDSIKASLREMHNHVKDLKIEILGDAANGDYTYTWSKMSGTALDSSMGFPANQPFSIRSVDIIRFQDGKAVEHWGYIDQQDLMMMRASQMPNATTVKVTMGDTSRNNKDTTKR
jgi:predicted SnoaL-like aldol condensation-catalyzing enzyme